MERSEVVKWLQHGLNDGPFGRTRSTDIRCVPADVLQTAIALLTPEPITEDGLRKAGWKETLPGFWKKTIRSNRLLLGYLLCNGESVWLHQQHSKTRLRIESMQHLQQFIAAFEGQD